MLSIIVAHDKNRLIGNKNKLPWFLPADLRYFKEKTTGHAVIMGRKTFESIGKPLPGRKNIILSKQNLHIDGAEVINDLNILEKYKQENQNYFILGGSTIYEQTLPLADYLYVTYIDHAFEGDAYFPEIDESEWEQVTNIKGIKNKKNPYDYYFRFYKRRA